ncbi:MAG TPA: hypothetical protein DDW52_23760 [Planctomycetaceae bacterium]|nr:hypothetical protein [Planctomycetaceae bacterium]
MAQLPMPLNRGCGSEWLLALFPASPEVSGTLLAKVQMFKLQHYNWGLDRFAIECVRKKSPTLLHEQFNAQTEQESKLQLFETCGITADQGFTVVFHPTVLAIPLVTHHEIS